MQRIDIKIQHSRIFLGLISFITIASMAIVISLNLNGLSKVVLSLSALSYGGWILWKDGLRKGVNSIQGLQFLPDGSCVVRYSSGEHMAQIQGDSTITTLVSVLRFKVPQNRQASIVIFKDAVSPEIYRQLLVWLKCFGSNPHNS